MSQQELDLLVGQYGSSLKRFALKLCHNYADADDLCQETWVKVLRFINYYDETQPFDKWLFSICINTYKDHKKSLYNRMQIHFSNNAEKDTFFNSLADTIKDDDELIDLLASVSKLPDKYKLLISLKYFNGYKDDDIAAALNIPTGTVKWGLNRAKKLLRRSMENEKRASG